MTSYLKLNGILIIFGMILSVSFGGFMDTDPTSLIKAYIDVSVDNLRPIIGQHKNHSYGKFDGVKCFEQIKYFKDQAKETQMWALKVIDSWSKIPSGLLSGNIRDLGNFDQCLSVEQNSGIPSVGTFRGHYCLTLLEPMIDGTISSDNEISSLISNSVGILTPYLATCIPDTCSPDAWEDIVNSLMNKYHVKVALHLHNYCHSKQTKIPMSNLDIFALIFFTTIVILMVVSTCAEYYLRVKGIDPLSSIWTVFSVYMNGLHIFNIKTEKSDSNTVECIDGLRTFSISWIVMSHVYTVLFKEPMINPTYVIEWVHTVFANSFFHSTFAVETFFVIGGFVLCWNRLRDLEKSNGKINFPFLIVKRYLNIMVSLMAAILFLVTMMKYLGTGPIYMDVFSQLIDICENYWLNTMLLIQNYASCCMEESWYLAVDFHLFCVSLFFIYGVWKFGKNFAFIIILPIIFTYSFQFYTIVVNDFEPATMNGDRLHSFLGKVYKATHMRMGSYFIGIILALYMHYNRDKKFNWSKLKIISMWVLSITAFCVSYMCIDDGVNNPNGVYKFATYHTFLRFLWAVNIAWIIFACYHGKAGIINQFLSYKAWQPIARLSFHIYITHEYVVLYFSARTQTPGYFDDLFLVRRFLGDLVISIFVSTIWCLAFGIPPNRIFYYMSMSQKKPIVNSVENGGTVELEKKL